MVNCCWTPQCFCLSCVSLFVPITKYLLTHTGAHYGEFAEQSGLVFAARSTHFPSTSGPLLFIPHKSMLSNCILSMSTTSHQTFILPSCILPTSLSFLSFFLFLPTSYLIFLSAALCLSFIHLLRMTLVFHTLLHEYMHMICVWNQEVKGSLSHISTQQRIFVCAWMHQKADCVCLLNGYVIIFQYLSLRAHCPYFCQCRAG